MHKASRLVPLRALLVGVVLVMLATGGWAALQRAGWTLPMLRPTLVGMHGPLMIGGLFGTLISLERAVAIAALARKSWHWSYAAPALSASGGLILVFIGMHPAAQILLSASSLLLVLIYAHTATVHHYWSLHTIILCAGAAAWAGGNLLWFSGQPLYVTVHGWIAFLVLTIIGERLELARVRKLTPIAERMLGVGICIYGLGVLLVPIVFDTGIRLAGLGQILIALWLLRFDIAVINVRRTGLTRYIAICLLTGYIWLAVGGGLAILSGAVYGGFLYDAVIHAVMVGFVLSMVFGHAPIIIPALTGRQFGFAPVFYLAVILLHVSVLLREYSDITQAFAGRMWAGMINAVAVVFFAGLVIYALTHTGHVRKIHTKTN